MMESLMSILRKCIASVMASSISIMMIPALALACGDHATGDAAPKLLDKSSIPASAFRYVNKPTETDKATAAAPTASAVPAPTLPVGPPR